MEKDGFHPHTQYKKGVRKSRDQIAKLQGVRMKRSQNLNLVRNIQQEKDASSVKYWFEDEDNGIIASLVDGDFPNEMEIRITTPDDRIQVTGHRSIMERMTPDQFKDKVLMHIERHEMMNKVRKKRDDHAKAKPYAGDRLTGTMIHDLRLLQKLNAHDGSVEDIDNLDDEQKEKLWKIMIRDEAFGVDHRNEKEMKDFYDNLSNEWKEEYGIKERKFNEETKSFDEFAKPSKWNDLKDSDKGILKLIVWRFNEPASSDNWHEIWKTGKGGKFIPNRDPIEVTQ